MVAAFHAKVEVDHPLLDRVRACSATPDLAANFFLRMLHPLGTARHSLAAQHDSYLAPTFQKMMREFPLPKSHALSAAALARHRDSAGIFDSGVSQPSCSAHD